MSVKTKGGFAVVSLAVAGLSGNATADAADGQNAESSSILDEIKSIAQSVNAKQSYTLAQHQSHQSHGSHGSHSSHRSYALPPIEDENYDENLVQNDSSGIQMAAVRNDRSTPANSILPSSPAITQKLKLLPGNSAKFKEIVQKMKLALISRGYEINTIDGEVDARTRAAVYKFQIASGMQPNGRVTPDVLTALNITTQ